MEGKHEIVGIEVIQGSFKLLDNDRNILNEGFS
jgi:hypothetical protein